MAAWRSIARIPVSVRWTLSSVKPPMRRMMAAKVGMRVAVVDMVGRVVVRPGGCKVRNDV